jgi:hypothetical protein
MRDEGKPAEVLIFREEDSVLAIRGFHQFLVNGALLELAYSHYVVSRRSQSSDDGEIATFVREESHAGGLVAA